MLKKLAMLGLSLLVLSAQPHAQTQGVKETPKHAEPSSSVPAVVLQKGAGQTFQGRQDNHISADVKVVSAPEKDGYDKATFWIGVALAVVGIGGVIIGVCSLVFIRKQTGEMRLQRIVTHNTLNAIKTQADLMKRQADALDRQNKAIRDRERARIAVIFPPLDPDFASPERFTIDEEPELMLAITIAIHNEGSTKAFDVRAEAAFQFQQKDAAFVATEITMGVSVPDVIRDEDLNNPILLTIETLVTAREVESLERAEADFYVFGKISYVDVFGFGRTTPFRLLWEVEEYEDTNGNVEFSKRWVNQSPSGT